eukprot:TRINITY_DN146_c0_g2_i1.p2 TRINITY_DN146_c0_g2~~TRINITY_DN146_c0_g2_i1.p2  ORF type:complete len:55 (+),score=2.13 TRINITY_DN146_c0_g2_i1:162-326(+)
MVKLTFYNLPKEILLLAFFVLESTFAIPQIFLETFCQSLKKYLLPFPLLAFYNS